MPNPDLTKTYDPVRAPTEPPQRKNWGRIWRVTVKNLRVNENAPMDSSTALMLNAIDPTGNPYFYTEVVTFEQRDWLPEGIRIQFDTGNMTTFQSYWCCDVVIYNLNDPTAQNMIQYGMTCVVEAGYMETGLGVVYEGTIFQPMWEKENGIDWKLTLRCVVGIIENTNNVINHTVQAGIMQRDLIADMLKHAKFPIQLNTGKFSNTDKLTRATTYFGQPNDLLQNIADANDCFLWFSNLAANIFDIEQGKTTQQWEYGIDNGLVGTPQQIEKGVILTVLLNPKIQLLHQIKLKRNVAIKQIAKQLGGSSGSFASILTEDYTYIVAALRHYGDTRGNDWYTEITGYFSTDQLLLKQW
jgi:hypothetical protein